MVPKNPFLINHIVLIRSILTVIHSEEIKKIVDLMGRNPNIGLNELFSKLRLSIGYTRHPVSLYRWLRTNGYYGIVKVKQTPYTPKPYKTPEVLDEK